MINWNAMAKDLAHWWWTPEHPSAYVTLNRAGGKAGMGLLAPSNPGAFNVYSKLAKLGPAQNYSEQFYQKTFGLHCSATKLCEHEFDGIPLGEWATLLKPAEFVKLFKGNPELVQAIQWGASVAEPRSYDKFLRLWEAPEHANTRPSN